jgi:hypothetical protein
MHGPINVKSPNNTSKWQMGFNSAFKGLREIPIGNLKEFTRVTKLETTLHKWKPMDVNHSKF